MTRSQPNIETDEEKEMVKIFCEQSKKHMTYIWHLGNLSIFKNNTESLDHLHKACYHMIMAENVLWNKYFNYGRIIREKQELEFQQKNKSKSLLDTIKKIFMLWEWKE